MEHKWVETKESKAADLTTQCYACLGQDSQCKHTTRSTSAHTSPTLHPPLPQLSLSLLGWLTKPSRLPRWRLPRLSVYFQARGPVLRQAGRQSVRRCGGGQRGWCVCQRGALPHSPGGWQQAGPAEGGSPLSHDLSGSCAHLGAIHFLPENSLPLQLQEKAGAARELGKRGEGEEFGFNASPGLGTASSGLKS